MAASIQEVVRRVGVDSLVTGMVVAESLRVGVDLDVLITGLKRVPAGRTVDGQPGIWTMCAVSCPDGDADAFADELAEALESGPWYADLTGRDVRYVVFAGRVFRYGPGQAEVRDAARAYGRSVGIPQAQLDWE